MKRLIPLFIALLLFAAALLLADVFRKKQRSVSYDGAVLVTAERLSEVQNAES